MKVLANFPSTLELVPPLRLILLPEKKNKDITIRMQISNAQNSHIPAVVEIPIISRAWKNARESATSLVSLVLK